MIFASGNRERLTDRVRGVLAQAESTAIARGASEIAPEDLLLAMARRDRGLGRAILDQMSIHLDQLQDELALLAPRLEPNQSPIETLGLSPQALHVFAWAKEEAAALGDKHLGTEHLVLGLLHDEKSNGGAFLRNRSASIERVLEVRRSLLGETTGSS